MFTASTFDFLRDLQANNTREWFEANRARWEREGKAPLHAFIEAFRPRLQAISPHFEANERSVFRIFRDVRFSKDKSPYKTHLAAQFRHAALKGPAGEVVHAPGFYLHIAPEGAGEMEGVFGGFGMWQPEPEVLRGIRARILAEPEAWEKARAGLQLTGSSLKKPPPGIDAAHPLAEDLKRKDFIAVVNFSEAEAGRTDFVDRFAEACARAAPLQSFLCGVVGLPF